MLRGQRKLTGQQLDGLTAILSVAVLLYVINTCIPLGGFSRSLAEPLSKREKGTLTIAVSMDGQERGVYSLTPGARISDLMLSLGMTISPEFDGGEHSHRLLTGDAVNLSTLVSSPPVKGKMSAAQSLALDLPLDINQAGFEDLVLVPGIGEKTAAQILALRVTKGRLRSVDELKELSGIKDKKFDKLKKYFFVVPRG